MLYEGRRLKKRGEQMCPICNSSDIKTTYLSHNKFGGTSQGVFKVCQKCGYGWYV